ncbi:hypothetical protein [Streptomyces sp. NPDC048385]|uniref:hypothetical protein n=1 Tax=Streptomyces sp. NPDC048385 TaxID=3155145 RepID=UPI0034469D69
MTEASSVQVLRPVRGMPVGQRVTGLGEVAADDAEQLVGEVAPAPGDVRVGRVAEAVVEVGGRGEDRLDAGQDAVVRGGQLGEDLGRVLGRGGFTDAVGEL